MTYNSNEYEQLEEIRKDLSYYMKTNHNCLVIWSDNTLQVPPKPYTTVSATSKIYEHQNHYDEQVDDVRYQVRSFKQTLSFNVRGVNTQVEFLRQPRELANTIRRWFLIYATPLLDKLNVAVVSIGEVGDRTTFLVDSYDYKVGFDVDLRMVQTDEYIKYAQGDETKENYDIIETVIVENEVNQETITITNK